jgi:hypothetical protein
MEILCILYVIHLGLDYVMGGFLIGIAFGIGFGAAVMTLPTRFRPITLLICLHGQKIVAVKSIKGRDGIVIGGMSQ